MITHEKNLQFWGTILGTVGAKLLDYGRELITNKSSRDELLSRFRNAKEAFQNGGGNMATRITRAAIAGIVNKPGKTVDRMVYNPLSNAMSLVRGALNNLKGETLSQKAFDGATKTLQSVFASKKLLSQIKKNPKLFNELKNMMEVWQIPVRNKKSRDYISKPKAITAAKTQEIPENEANQEVDQPENSDQVIAEDDDNGVS